MSAPGLASDVATSTPVEPALLVLPRLRVQNANAISSPLTWGFPAISAFLGFMTALERRLGTGSGMAFRSVGVVCHDFEAQVTEGGYTRAFHLTRNPVLADGSTASIVEEGRVHLDVSLVFDVLLTAAQVGDAARRALADRAAEAVAGMRLAGGSVMPPLPTSIRRPGRATLEMLAESPDAQHTQLRRLARRCLPGFALVSRDDLLQRRCEALQDEQPEADVLDAWLDLARLNFRAVQTTDEKGELSTAWHPDQREGWTVPIPVGYAGLSELHAPGTVTAARDGITPFRFVESLWSMGEWIGPHRLRSFNDLFWYAQVEGEQKNIYRCRNDYDAPAATAH